MRNLLVENMMAELQISLTWLPGHNECAAEIKPMLGSLFKDVFAIVSDDSIPDTLYRSVTGIVECAREFARNTQASIPLTADNIDNFKRLFDIFHDLLAESKKFSSGESATFKNKIDCIQTILFLNYNPHVTPALFTKNMVFGYNALVEITSYVATYWDDVYQRCFNKECYKAFLEALNTNTNTCLYQSDEDKMELFFEMLDGNLKLIPVHKLVAVGHELVPVTFNYGITDPSEVLTLSGSDGKAYQLEPKNVKI